MNFFPNFWKIINSQLRQQQWLCACVVRNLGHAISELHRFSLPLPLPLEKKAYSVLLNTIISHDSKHFHIGWHSINKSEMEQCVCALLSTGTGHDLTVNDSLDHLPYNCDIAHLIHENMTINSVIRFAQKWGKGEVNALYILNGTESPLCRADLPLELCRISWSEREIKARQHAHLHWDGKFDFDTQLRDNYYEIEISMNHRMSIFDWSRFYDSIRLNASSVFNGSTCVVHFTVLRN